MYERTEREQAAIARDRAWVRFVQHPSFVHLTMTAVMGRTYRHLIDDHGETEAFDPAAEHEPIGETVTRRNARLHLRAHRGTEEKG